MQLVRCDSCGAKALVAASQCPRCAAPFYLRDGRGRPLALAHCRGCETYYPRSRPGCKWCVAPPRATRSAQVGRWVIGTAVVLAGLVGGWRLRATASEARPELAAQAVAPAPEPPAVAPIDSSAATEQAPDPASPGPPSPASDAPAALPSVAPGATDDVTGPWARGVVEMWVNIRATASRGAIVVGILSPNTDVQLGPERGGWRAVRGGGLEGWADGRYFRVETAAR